MEQTSTKIQPPVRRGHKRPTLKQFKRQVRGEGPGEVRRWLKRSFGAANPGRFWHYWNPNYGYYLLYFVYHPLSRVLPRPAALYLTFLACGFFAHDLLLWAIVGGPRFPIFSVLFSFFAAEVMVTEALHFDLSKRAFAVRSAANICFLAGAIGGAGLVEHFV
jgi:hypothetical protein